MTDKKITRRGFVQGMAACLVSVPFVPGLVKCASSFFIEDKPFDDNGSQITLLALAKNSNFSAKEKKVVELLNESNSILDDISWMPLDES